MDYDVLNRVTAVTEPGGLGLAFEYDESGNRTRKEDSLGGVETSVYDLANRLESRLFSDGTASTKAAYLYSARNQVTELFRYDTSSGVATVGYTSYAYDSSQRQIGITHRDGSSSVIQRTTYAYDLADRMTTRTIGGVTQTFAYNDNDEVTGDGLKTYAYDATGNRSGGGYVVNAGNQTVRDGTWTYAYDAAGNRTLKTKGTGLETWEYHYDHLNHLTYIEGRTSSGGGGTLISEVSYGYDVFGNRIARDQWDGVPTAPIEERYAYDGWKVQQDFQGSRPSFVGQENWDVWADLDDTWALETRRIYGEGFDQMLSRVSNSAVAWYHADTQGSITALTDAAGAVINQLAYNGYGEVISESSPANGDRYGYTGREEDIQGLMFYRDRTKQSDLNQFLTRDRKGFAAGDMNLVRYVGNGFVNNEDPSGMRWVMKNREMANAWSDWMARTNHMQGQVAGVESSVIPLEDQTYWIDGNPSAP